MENIFIHFLHVSLLFVQEKNGNILVGGYSPPSIGKRPIYFQFFLLKASLMENEKKIESEHGQLAQNMIACLRSL